ncbi:Epoxyqueuosine reductase [Moorella humiferrea]|uniref:tRNA epoxyqueuosine(34) reductase QueG n=1 Tax=Neomoorella humiferrea TaxID=676965 RepID=UPI0030CDB3A8
MREKELKEWALERGLVLGIAPAQPFQRGVTALKWREERGIITPFACGSLEDRCHPRLLYPMVRSLIVVAKPHPDPDAVSLPAKEFIARYALGTDYHDELQNSLQELAQYLRQNGAEFTAVQVDSGPLLEREAAYLAGLGYYGANCNLIIPGMGSAVSLGILLTDLELEPGAPFEPATCAECGRCLKACPTKALVAPGRLDPARCLSYLTQARGVVPSDLRPFFKRYLWGCDVCQEVCPAAGREPAQLWEQGAEDNSPEGSYRFTELAAILAMDNEQFTKVFGTTPLAWRGKTVIQRNAVLLLGNWGDLFALPLLEKALRSPSPVVRGHAAWALGRFGTAARPLLDKARRVETDPWVRREIEDALDAV